METRLGVVADLTVCKVNTARGAVCVCAYMGVCMLLNLTQHFLHCRRGIFYKYEFNPHFEVVTVFYGRGSCKRRHL